MRGKSRLLVAVSAFFLDLSSWSMSFLLIVAKFVVDFSGSDTVCLDVYQRYTWTVMWARTHNSMSNKQLKSSEQLVQ